VTLCPQSRELEGPQCRSEITEKSKSSSRYQNPFPDLSARRINKLLAFIIIVMTDFSLDGLGLTVLQLNEGMYKIYKAKEPVLKVEIKE
jgi:hypothetical protein